MRLTPASFASTLLFVPVALGVAACSDDAAVTDTMDDTDGIDSVSGGSTGLPGSTTGDGTTTDDTVGEATGDTSAEPCMNGEQDGDETDVDCGGGTCDPCGAGGKCSVPEDCDTMICGGGFCQGPTCYDEMQNGDEEGVDCGGTCPNSCVGTGCTSNNQCDAGFFCNDDGECQESSCENGIQDTAESDVDCGGGTCPDCPDGAACQGDADCASGVCDPGTNTCAAASCTDTVQNGNETDIDCGGPECPVCPLGSDCVDNTDCIDGVCEFMVCASADCSDMVHNGEETDVDCGGPMCLPCAQGLMCAVDADCLTNSCDPVAGVCLGPECNDGVQNGDETDIDCGGLCGATCGTGQGCAGPGDCMEGVCEFGECSAPDCNDSVQNGDETDIDCGGLQCGATCMPGEGCLADTDCVEGICDDVTMTCAMAACDDLVQNGAETDVDCGGALCGATCDTGQTCFGDGDCISGVCTLAQCQAPACDDGVQNGTELGVDCAGGCPLPCPIGEETIVNATTDDFQVQPAIAAAPDGSFYVVVWASFPVNFPAQDGSGSGVYAQMYDNTGLPIGGEFLVNTTTLDNQQFPAVDAFNTGFVIAWQSAGTDGSGQGVYAQRFDDNGVAQGGEFLLNQTTAGHQRRPDIALDASGNIVACWEGEVSTFEIFCRLFSSLGAAVTNEFQVNSVTTNTQALPVVERAGTGEFTVAWQSAGDQDGSLTGIFLRRFQADGTVIGVGDLQVNTFTVGDQNQPDIGMNAAGDHVIAWSSDGQDGSSTGVYAQMYAAGGAPVGGEFQVNTTTVGAQNSPAVDLNAAGQFVVVFQTADDGALTGIFGQRYLANGTPLSTEFPVNITVAGLQETPDVAMRGLDEIVTVFSSGDSAFTNRDVVLQRYDAQFP